MKNAGQERGIWGALRCWGPFVLRCLALLGAMIALIALVGFGYADIWAYFFGYRGMDEFSAGGRFTRDLLLALLALVGIGMAAWRNQEMSRQSNAALKQAEIALAQSRISEKRASAMLRKIKNESDRIADERFSDGVRIAGERFSDGVKMLAQNNKENESAIAARIGGIYALQSLANNYVSQYAAQVVKTLVAYVRGNAQLTKIPYKGDQDMYFLGEDVKAAFAVLAQLLDERDKSPKKKFALLYNDLDFSDCDFSHLFLDCNQINGLRHYRWQEADLRKSDLCGANLRGANLRGANLEEALLNDADLRGANLCGANLEEAHLCNADLRGASLGMEGADKTNLQSAKLCCADLRGAAFSGANLICADLNGAKLQDTDLREANLSDAQGLPRLSSQIWHSKQLELKKVKSIKASSNRVWDLKPYRDCPYALAGVLHNFNDYHGLQKAACKLLDDNTLPPGFSENWRKWLEKVKPDFRK